VYILNTLELDKDYSEIGEIVSLKPISEYGLPEEFYGGRVQMIAHLKDSPVMLLINNQIDGLQVIDIAVNDLADIPIATLKKYAKNRGLNFGWSTATKEEVLNLLTAVTNKVA
jgi:hypothetical protein